MAGKKSTKTTPHAAVEELLDTIALDAEPLMAETPQQEETTMEDKTSCGDCGCPEELKEEKCECCVDPAEGSCEAQCCCDECTCGERNKTTYEMPCAIGDEVYRVTRQGDDYGNVSVKVQKGRVVAMRLDEKSQVWLQVDFGVNLPATTLLASEYDYNTFEVGQRIEKLYK